MEELRAVPPAFVRMVVMPTLAKSSFIGITSLNADADEGDDSLVDDLISRLDDKGDPLFRLIDIKLVCPRCRALGKELTCRHMLGDLPQWMDERRNRQIQLMMGDQTDVWLKEMRCVAISHAF